MARRSREDFPNTVHHVCNRAIGGLRIFRDDEDAEFFLSLLTRWSRELGIHCLGWCLPFNHWHLLIERGDHPIADFMQRVISAHAIYVNRKYCREGHVVQRRYESRRIEHDGDLRWMLAYSLGNLVRHHHTTTERLGEFVLSSGYAGAMGQRPARSFEAWPRALRAFDDDTAKAREALRELITWAEANVWRRSKAERLEETIAAVCAEAGMQRDELARAARTSALDARAEIVRRALAEVRLSREELAKALGVSKQAINRAWERSRKPDEVDA
jgi:REP element-mobilizing transposase RayT/DNA-binding transcriptional regulator YiaG